ncbi:MAG: radical SAM protein [Planctomycetota bacterium]
MTGLKPIIVPKNSNYLAVFLSLSCNMKCSYCINYFEEGNFSKQRISGADWVKGLNRIVSRDDVPLTLQGGEPSLHPDFIYIINSIKEDLQIDILTNLKFDVDRFIKEVDPDRLNRNAPYANIRVSYHPEQMDLDQLIPRALKMQDAGFRVGIYGVLHPTQTELVNKALKRCRELGIDFRPKEFLGHYNGNTYGTFLYPGAIDKQFEKECFCRTTELIIGPSGGVYRCHHDLYENFPPIGHILDPEFHMEDKFRICKVYGHCNPCDIKIKTNRLQQYGHTSVKINFP